MDVAGPSNPRFVPVGERQVNLACTECRRSKLRCTDNENATMPCKRCRRRGTICDFSTTKRGPRLDETRSSLPASFAAGPSRSALERTSPPSNGIISPIQSSVPIPALDHLNPDIDTSAARHRNEESSYARRFSPKADVDMSSRLNPDIGDLSPMGDLLGAGRERGPDSGHAGVNHAAGYMQTSFEDPITMGYIEEAEAHKLISLYHQHLNPLIGLLDPHLHTAMYLRKTSLILYTTILAASSKFFRNSLNSALMHHSRAMLSRAIDTGRCETGIIQAILVMVYWKEPTDKSAWIKIGVAIRMAYQRGWHVQRREELPDDELAARQILDNERTWYCLICAHRMQLRVRYADLFGLPSTIKMSDAGDCENWARAHIHLDVAVDMHLACSIDSQGAREFWSRVRRDQTSIPKPLLTLLIDDLYQSESRHEKKWFGENGIALQHLTDKDRNLLHWFDLSSLLLVKHHQLTLTPPVDVDACTSECMELATYVVEKLERVSNDGILPFLYDAGSCTLSNFGIVVYQLHHRLSDSQRAYIYSLLERVRSCCISAQSGHSEGAMTLCDRFFQRVLQIMRSAPAHPQQSTAQSNTEQGVDQMGEFDMDAFLRATMGPQFDHMFVDNDYWATLFSADP